MERSFIIKFKCLLKRLIDPVKKSGTHFGSLLDRPLASKICLSVNYILTAHGGHKAHSRNFMVITFHALIETVSLFSQRRTKPCYLDKKRLKKKTLKKRMAMGCGAILDTSSTEGLLSKWPVNMKFLLCGLVCILTLIQGKLTVNVQDTISDILLF